MAIIRKVFGPFARDISDNAWAAEIRWYFHGIRGDYTVAHWALVFDPKTRTFRATNIQIGQMVGRRNRAVAKALPKDGIGEEAHPHAWLDDSPVKEGTVSEILKQYLSREDIALASALAITRR